MISDNEQETAITGNEKVYLYLKNQRVKAQNDYIQQKKPALIDCLTNNACFFDDT